MNLQEINFEQAKLLKQAGFVEHTTKFYDKNGVLTGSLPVNHNLHKDRFSCCTIALAIEWLSETKGLDVGVVKAAIKRWKYKIVDVYGERIGSGEACPRWYAQKLGLDEALKIQTTTP